MIDMTGIDQLPSGQFRFRFRHAGEDHTGTAPTAEECAAYRDETKRLLAKGELVLVRGMTVAQAGPTFLHSRRKNRAEKDDTSRWHKHIAARRIGKLPIRAVTRRDVLAWLGALVDTETDHKWGTREAKPLSWQTRKHCLNLLRKFFEWAMNREDQLALINPCVGVRVEREDGDEDEGYQDGWYLDVPEQAKLLAAFDELDVEEHPTARFDRVMVAFAIATGLRDGEQRCLHLADLVVDGPSPHVMVRYGSWDPAKQRYRSPKGRKGDKRVRRVPLFGPGLEAARTWLELLPTYAPENPLGLVFPAPSGARRWQKPRSWAAAVAKLGVLPRLGKRVWWHLLRHTCASSLVAGWWGVRWSFEDVRAVLGHSSVKVTERYAHLVPAVVEGTATVAEAAWRMRRHDLVTLTAGAGAAAAAIALRSRKSSVRIRPGVPLEEHSGISSADSPTRDDAVTTVVDAIRAIAAGDPNALRVALEALGVAHDALVETASVREVAS